MHFIISSASNLFIHSMSHLFKPSTIETVLIAEVKKQNQDMVSLFLESWIQKRSISRKVSKN